MGCFTSHKLIDTVENVKGRVSDNGFRVCDFEIEDTGIFLQLKIYRSKEPKKYREVKISLTDFVFQILTVLSSEQKKALLKQLNMEVSK